MAEPKKCSIPGCDRETHRRNICDLHNGRKRRGIDGSKMMDPPQIRDPARGCSVPGCVNPYSAKSFCAFHYQRVQYGWTVEQLAIPVNSSRIIRPDICRIEGCDRPTHAVDLCKQHSWQQRQGKLVGSPIKKIGKRGSGCISSGYKSYRIGGRTIKEHRLVVERFLGRELTRDENIHHRNGDRLDNSIGPCLLSSSCDCKEWHNLELWPTTQPSGKRVCDLLSYARTIIAKYGEKAQQLEDQINGS